MFLLLEGFGNEISIGDRNFVNQINANPEEFINISITKFAQKINVVESTVTKFIKRIGFKNYRNFQAHISRVYTIKQENTFYHLDTQEEKDITILKNYDFYAINETIEKIDTQEFKRFIAALLNSHKIYCVGSGNSFLSASDLSDALNRIGLIAFRTNDIFGYLQRIKSLTSEDMVVLFSEKYENLEYRRLVNLCKKQGVKIVLITARNRLDDETKNSLSFVINFYSHPTDNRPIPTINCKIQQIFVNNFIITNLWRLKRERDNLDYFEKDEHVW